MTYLDDVTSSLCRQCKEFGLCFNRKGQPQRLQGKQGGGWRIEKGQGAMDI